MDPFDSVLGRGRGQVTVRSDVWTPAGLLTRLDALCANFDTTDELSDAAITLLATGHGFRWSAHGTDDYLLSDYVRGWSAALLHFDGDRWRAYVCRELVAGLRPVSA